MARTMYDSTHASAIPTSAQMVAGYVDGAISQWSQADWDRFPNAVKLFVTVLGGTADVLDVENGDATPDYAPGWARRMRSLGRVPTVYCNASTWPTVQSAFASQGVPEPEYWIANYDGVQQIPPGAVAKQYANSAMTGGDWDLSIVADYWPGVDPAPPPVIPTGGGKKLYIQFQATVVAGKFKGVEGQFLSDGMRFRWIQNPQQLVDIQGILGASLVQHTPGVSVADPLAFGLPADAVTAAMLGLSFGAELGDF